MKIFVTVLKIAGIILLLALLGAGAYVAGVGTGLYYALTPAGNGDAVRIDVNEGSSAGEVAEKLEKSGVIQNALLFKAAMILSHSETSIKPGSYLIDPGENMMEILNQLKKGNFRMRLVTIPEGLTLKQIAILFEKNGVAKAKDIMRASEDKPFHVGGKKLESLEGFLLPDTYDFPDEFSAFDVLNRMIEAFNENALPLYDTKKDRLPYKLTLKQVVTLASMVEREAQVPAERPVIAMVYYNRLNRGMKMECDATIQYALKKHKQYLKLSDLKIDSPYNTYLHQGLPRGPIANPGIESIRAVLNPASVKYLYYVRNDIKNDGSHVFSCTFAEHNAAISKYQR
jgi:UPF0755 protein